MSAERWSSTDSRIAIDCAGAERLAEPVRVAWFERFGIRVLEGYGATETAPVLAINTPMAYRGGTVGQLLPASTHVSNPSLEIPALW